jgi:hypothetical protein
MKKLCLPVLLCLSIIANAQIDGLWVVKKVMVGSETMTPVARWFKLDNGKQTSGNGWQQHSFGTYVFNAVKSTVQFDTANEPVDESGAFTVVRKGNAMTWTRKEDGEDVSVELELATTFPMSTADKVKGLWGLGSATRNGTDLTSQYNPQNKYSLFLRWDKIYNLNTGTEKINGYWHMNAHRPELKLIRMGHEQEVNAWTVSVSDDSLILTGLSDNNSGIVLSFKKLRNFPK